METTLKKRSVSKYSRVFSTEFTGESSAEAVVSDVLPDIAEILCPAGQVLLRSKTTEPGQVSLSASVSASVVYAPENEPGLRSVRVTIPFAARAEDEKITEDCRTIVSLRLLSLDARMLNPRKVTVRAEVLISIECYLETELELVEDIETGEQGALHIRKSAVELSVVSCVREKTFVVTDDYRFPPDSREPREILASASQLHIDDVKAVGGKLVFKGGVESRLLCAVGDEQSPRECVYTTMFSQMMEMDLLGEEPDSSWRVMLTAAYYELVTDAERGSAVSMELHFVAQAVSRNTLTLEAVTDAYSNRLECTLTTESIEQTALVRRQSIRAAARAVLETPEPAREIIYAEARPTRVTVDGGKVTVRLSAMALYEDHSGVLRAARGSLTSGCETELCDGMSLCPDAVYFPELFASAGADGIELRVPVEMELLVLKTVELRQISGVEPGEPAAGEGASVTLVPHGEEELWELAKRCRSTVELIEQANPVDENGAYPRRLLLIPREL